MMKNLLILAIISLGLFAGHSEAQVKRVYQLSGLVVNRSNHEPVPFARVSVNNTRRGTIANNEGFYSIPVADNDTIYYSSLGFRTGFMVFGEYLKEYQGDVNSAYVYVINYLDEDSISLAVVTIFPYNTPNALRTAIIETEVPEGVEGINARNNLNPKVMDRLISTLTVDEGERVMVARQLYYNQQLHRNVAPTMPLFDPVAVYQLLRYINEKSKAKKERSLDYWND